MRVRVEFRVKVANSIIGVVPNKYLIQDIELKKAGISKKRVTCFGKVINMDK